MSRPIVLHLVGWVLVGLLDFALNRGPIGWAVYAAAMLGGVGLAVSSLLAFGYRRLPGTFVIAVGAVVASTVWYVLLNAFDHLVGSPLYEPFFEGLFGRGMLLLFIMLAWHGGFLAVRASERAIRAERLAQEARIEMLRYQLNPHFLHNVLNSVIALIDENPPRAQAMLELLSNLLRRTLEEDTGSETSLARELELIERYLEIQTVRFEDKLRVVIDVSDAARSCAIPPLMLHAIVENAVKHGLETAVTLPVEIRVVAAYDGAALRIEVTNTGALVALAARREGVGLRNIAARLDALYPSRHSFAIAERDGAVHATMEIRAPRVIA